MFAASLPDLDSLDLEAAKALLIDLDRSTLAGWVGATSELLAPWSRRSEFM